MQKSYSRDISLTRNDRLACDESLTTPHSTRFAEYAIDHLKRLIGSKMLVDFNEAAAIQYQNARLGEGAAPKSVNEEVGFLLRILGDPGDLIRIRLRKKKMLKLKVRQTVGRAYTLAEKGRMLAMALHKTSKGCDPHHQFEYAVVLPEIRKASRGVVHLSFREAESERPHAACYHVQDGMEHCAHKGHGEGGVGTTIGTR